MKLLAKALVNEPVLLLAAVLAGLGVLGAEGVIAGWIPAVSTAAAAPILRHFVTPEFEVGDE